MNRRMFLKQLGVGTSLGLAGCASSDLLKQKSTPTPTTAPANKEPIPSKATFYTIANVDEKNQVMSAVMSGFNMPRPATINLYRHQPTDGDPGSWAYYNPRGVKMPRPYLKFQSEGVKVSSTKLDAVGKDNIFRKYDLNYPAADEPAGVPLVYHAELVEHTLDGQRRDLGMTPIMLKNPRTGEIHHPRNQYGGAVPQEFNDYGYNRVEEGGYANITVIGSSNDTRWNTPRKEKLQNRPMKVGKGAYVRRDFERPWAIQYKISTEEYHTWLEWNIRKYTANLNDPYADLAQLYRLIDDKYDGAEVVNNDILARVAENLNKTAENSGLVTPLQKLRFVADFAQWMPYTDDSQIPDDMPRVQHPVTTLYKYTGDCEDKVVLVMALLWQDAFPDFKLSAYFLSTPGHVGVAIRKDSIPGWNDYDTIGEAKNYMYMEVTSPAPLGMYTDTSSVPDILNITPPGHPNVNEYQ